MIDATGLIHDATGRMRAANVNRPGRNPLIQLSLMALAAVLGIGSWFATPPAWDSVWRSILRSMPPTRIKN